MDNFAARRRPALLVTANLFGIPFGVAGLALCWSTAHDLTTVPSWPAHLLWVVAGLTYLVILVAYLKNVVGTGRAATEASDLTFGPFTALIFIMPMLLGHALTDYAPRVGMVIFLASVALVVVYGGWLSGQWIIHDMPLDRWHPGYFLPTVAGPLVAAAGCAALGFGALARLLFGFGLICWIILGSIILVRLFTRPMLPAPLVPTLAIEMAPPAVAGLAWFAINDNKPDTVAYLLAGYAVLMLIVQVRLIELCVRVPFAAGAWAYAFSSAAVFSVSIRWLFAVQIQAREVVTYFLLAAISGGIAVLAVRTLTGLTRGSLLPRASSAVAGGATP